MAVGRGRPAGRIVAKKPCRAMNRGLAMTYGIMYKAAAEEDNREEDNRLLLSGFGR